MEMGTGGAYAEYAKLGDGRVIILDGLDVVGNIAGNLGWGECAKELAELLLLVLVVRGVPVVIAGSDEPRLPNQA